MFAAAARPLSEADAAGGGGANAMPASSRRMMERTLLVRVKHSSPFAHSS
jgi:hypothetical protein